MIRFKIDQESTELLDRITAAYNFKKDTITSRIAFAISISNGKIFNEDDEDLPGNGREYTPTSNIFGHTVQNVDNFILYKTILDQHYQRELDEEEFVKYYKLHLKAGLIYLNHNLNEVNITQGEHIEVLIEAIKKGLNLRSHTVQTAYEQKTFNTIEYNKLLSFDIGTDLDSNPIVIKINDLKEFDSRNIAIAGMAGSGKTQLIKDILYQISKNTDNSLKFIFFDYKGEGNLEQLQTFLDATDCDFVDIIKDGGVKFNPFYSISFDEKQRPFNIRAFVDTVATFIPGIGVNQKNILNDLITNLFRKNDPIYPTIEELFTELQDYYNENKRNSDSLYSVVKDLSTNIFNCSSDASNLFSKSIYLNLPPTLSDTLRQLVVFLLLRYFVFFFSTTNDCEPKDEIFPLRYIIVIDEAHIYLKNKNARIALEELLRLMRSKGVIVVMLSQGVADYRTRGFDFASQVKLPICLNIQNKDYKTISSFIGTPTSKYKLEKEIKKLEPGKGLINITEPKTFELRQWYKTQKNLT